MRTTRLLSSAVALTGLSAALLTAPNALAGPKGDPAGRAVDLRPLGTFSSGVFDESAAEIVQHDPDTDRLFVVNAQSGAIDVLDGTSPSSPTKITTLSVAGQRAADDSMIDLKAVVNSVAVDDGILAVAVEAADKVQPGWVAFYETAGDLRFLSAVRAGSLPDMVTFTPDGATVLVANEGEPADDFLTDPEGSVSLVDVSGGVEDLTQSDVRTALFAAFAGDALPKGVRVFGPDVPVPAGVDPAGRVARNLEPEYITVEADSSTAYVALQEASTIAVLDVAAAEFSELLPLGTKDWNPRGRTGGFDASDRDDEVNIQNWPVRGMLMPDAISSYQSRGRTYLVTANEGDAREGGGYSDEVRLGDGPDDEGFQYLLCAGFDAGLADEDQLGRLNVSREDGYDAARGCYREIHTYGGRSFSIFSTDGRQVFDSGSAFEQLVAAGEGGVPAEAFNAAHDDNDSFDSRSDAKGPEPEGVTVGEIDGRTYAFISLERVGGVMTYDITEPKQAFFVDYVNNRDFEADVPSRQVGDLGAEGVTFISPEDSPTDQPLVVVANEVSGTTTVFAVD
ncbi:MAG: choice-of-anchor I family protein [Frankiaceae bacterium]|nr:choice-of-anchor I family protein [Frankiaceae bacterium]